MNMNAVYGSPTETWQMLLKGGSKNQTKDRVYIYACIL